MHCDLCNQTPFGKMYVRGCPDCGQSLCAACFENEQSHSCYQRPDASKAPVCTCGNQMVLRHRKIDGKPFFGCRNFGRGGCSDTADTSTL